jgi:hypothetical protein
VLLQRAHLGLGRPCCQFDREAALFFNPWGQAQAGTRPWKREERGAGRETVLWQRAHLGLGRLCCQFDREAALFFNPADKRADAAVEVGGGGALKGKGGGGRKGNVGNRRAVGVKRKGRDGRVVHARRGRC